ncbi:MAG: hypothetical protein IKZ47_01255 [Clostridia bacterium]|nr:hypothetical protein [Clostridia bacterium]
MKKALLIICAALMLFAAGCKKDAKATVEHSVDIAYYADTGAVPGAAFKAGETVSEGFEENENMFVVENGARSFASSGDYYYYFDIDSPPFTVDAVVSFTDCYGFDIGTVSIEVTKVLEAQGIKYNEHEPANEELFFLPGAGTVYSEEDSASGRKIERTVVECTSLKHKLIFVFEENALCAAACFK